jgi:parallel beta-helix repeat protein
VLVASTGNEILGNSLKGNGGDGIELRAGSDNCRIADNKVLASLHDGLDNSGLNTVIAGNTSKANGGADLAGAGNGTGTVQLVGSTGNKVGDDSDLVAFTTLGELEMP